MCLGAPGQILQIVGNEAVADFWGQQQIVRLDMLEASPSERLRSRRLPTPSSSTRRSSTTRHAIRSPLTS